MRKIILGAYIQDDQSREAVRINCNSPTLRRHIREPWLLDYIEREIGQQLDADESTADNIAAWSSDVAERHSAIYGGSGGGKSVAMSEIMRQQFEAKYTVA